MKKILLAATAALLLGGNAIADECFGLPQEVVDQVLLKTDEYCKNKKNVIHYDDENECIKLVLPKALEKMRYKYAIDQAKQRQSKH
jgi:hypothetical protein